MSIASDIRDFGIGFCVAAGIVSTAKVYGVTTAVAAFGGTTLAALWCVKEAAQSAKDAACQEYRAERARKGYIIEAERV